MNRISLAAILLGSLLLPGAYAFAETAPSVVASLPDKPFDIVVQHNVMIPMRDGVRLATDIYRPAHGNAPIDGRFPAILERTPYGKANLASLASFFVAHGYVMIGQDVRGRYDSEGHWRPLYDDGRDGAETLKWIGDQPWSNGKVGTTGTSYDGGTQHALAIAGAPNLAAMVPVDAMSNVGLFGMRHQGAFELRWLNWVFTLGNATGGEQYLLPSGALGERPDSPLRAQLLKAGDAAARRAAADPSDVGDLIALGDEVRKYVMTAPITAGGTPLKYAPDYERWLVAAMGHGNADSFWTDMGVNVADHVADYEDVPVLHVTGSYDSWGAQVANINYATLVKAKRSPQRLLFGPWTHGGQRLTYAGAAEFGPDAAVDMNALRLRWFDHWLKGTANGVEHDPPVRIFVMGGGDAHKTPDGRLFVGGHWRDEHEWPLARTIYTSYFLEDGGGLSTTPPKASPPARYRFDPHDPVPTIGGNVSSVGVLMQMGAEDQRCKPSLWPCKDSKPLSARPDVRVFETAPLSSDVEITGPVTVELWASSDAPDTDFTAKLVDVYPPNADFPEGVDLNVGDGIVRARYRDSLTVPTMMKPGEIYKFTITLYPTSLVIKAGHRIRVDVSSSNFPRFDINPNTGEPLNANRHWRAATNAIYHDPKHPSHIVLPVIPASTN